MVSDLRLPRNLAHPLWNETVSSISRDKHGLTQLAPVPPTSSSAYFRFVTLFLSIRQDKELEVVVRGQVASDDG